jgi:hypothetical protein
MFSFAQLARLRFTSRRHRASAGAVRQMDALPAELQADIGWTPDSRARAYAVYHGI